MLFGSDAAITPYDVLCKYVFHVLLIYKINILANDTNTFSVSDFYWGYSYDNGESFPDIKELKLSRSYR